MKTMTQSDNQKKKKKVLGKERGRRESESKHGYLKDTEEPKHWEMKARWEELDGHAGEGPVVLKSSHWPVVRKGLMMRRDEMLPMLQEAENLM